jgi:protein-S-isoprenylcysteine O-methyltransferase Ste14
MAVFLPIRIAVEEGFLNKVLPGYPDYARRVRARLIPFLL